MIMPNPKPIIIVQGGQWGSEAKGAIAAYLGLKRDVNYAVRTGAVNAGHTVYHYGHEFKMQQLPVGFVHPRTQLILGAGAMINPYILAREIKEIRDTLGEDIRERLLIDFRCGLHMNHHQSLAAAANRHHKMGATGKGCSEAVTAKIRCRGEEQVLLFRDWLYKWGSPDTEVGAELASYLTGLSFVNTELVLNDAYDQGCQILLEATQGAMLDLHLGPYPYTSHKQTIAGQWLSECGLSPALETEIVLVCRTYPIRVAGNSGPMPGEISWSMLAEQINGSLLARRLPPLVSNDALDEFRLACVDIAASKYVPDGLCPVDSNSKPDVDFHTWDQTKREQYRVVISELHKDALNAIGPTSLLQLKHLFEMTTVTRKLRRVAAWDRDTMRASIRQNRPAYTILTFLNYEFPEYWGCPNPDVVFADVHVRRYIDMIEKEWGTTIGAVTTGPFSAHILPTPVWGAA